LMIFSCKLTCYNLFTDNQNIPCATTQPGMTFLCYAGLSCGTGGGRLLLRVILEIKGLTVIKGMKMICQAQKREDSI